MIVWIASYPRSGNTFLRVVLNHVFDLKTYSIHNDPVDIGADAETAETVGHLNLPEDFSLEEARASGDLYLIKTHGLPENDEDRAIYLVRDGRSAVLSYAHYKHSFSAQSSVSNYMNEILSGHDHFVSWGDHVAAWDPQVRPNTLLLKFEDLVSDPGAHLLALSDFLGRPVGDGDIPAFKELSEVNSKMFREGKLAAWKEQLTEEQQLLFWLDNYEQMSRLGYVEGMPAILEDKLGKGILSLLHLFSRSQGARLGDGFRDLQGSLGAQHELLNSIQERSGILDPMLPDVISDLVELSNFKSKEIIRSAEELASLRADFDALNARSQGLEVTIRSREEQLEKMQDTVARLRKDLGIAESRRKWLRENVDERMKEIWRHKQANAELSKENLKLSEEKAGLLAEKDAVNLRVEELQDLVQQLTGLVKATSQQRALTSPRAKYRAYRKLVRSVLSGKFDTDCGGESQ